MAITDILGNTITTGTHVVVAIPGRNKARPTLVHGDIVGAVLYDNGEHYFHVAIAVAAGVGGMTQKEGGTPSIPYARARIVYDKASTTTGQSPNCCTVAS